MKLHDAVPALDALQHRGLEFPVAEEQLGPGLRFSARAAETFPFALAQIAQQDQLHGAAAAAAAKQPRRQHAGIVEHQTVALVQIGGQIVKMPMLDLTRFPVQDEQPRMVALRDRGLRDQLFGEVERKVRFFHRGTPLSDRYAPPL